ncbi:helix-turn-helix domain-containing protein [Pusillimonas sp. TS35]|uniref:IclR family transcriptional regulator n=1 Tax=Paracandidimonas lactea TaxID=2895524 RepID=UPI00136E1E84|nr:IclR family transcriptional regulator [Paracandidimonas lactea]MYN13367.1 helix-turn-helix domain-containing protein [Pusillimonas sp. TS35]
MTASKPAAPARDRRQRVQSASTGMVVLKGLAALGGRASLSVLAKHVSENPAKVHRYLISMVEEGLVDQDPTTLQYSLGAGSIQIGLAAMRLADPIRVAEPALVRLRQTLEMTCFIAVMGNKGPTIVRFEEPGLPVTLNVRVGSVLSLLWSATGRAFLGYLDDTRIEDMAREELAHVSAERRAMLDPRDPIGKIKRDVQKSGLAVVKNTNLQGISAIALPIFDFSDRVAAVLTVLGTTGSFEASASGPVAQAMRKEGEAISAALGHVA